MLARCLSAPPPDPVAEHQVRPYATRTAALSSCLQVVMPKPSTKSYYDFVVEQLRCELHGVFIDDTGSPGLRTGSEELHPERKSWVAVVILRTQLPDLDRKSVV